MTSSPFPPATSTERFDSFAPSLDELVRLSVRGDRAAFATLYDETVPWVHAMALGHFADPADAAEATVLTYLTAWDEASEAELDLAEDDEQRHRERAVFTWLEVLAHRVMARLLREDGPGDASPAESATAGSDVAGSDMAGSGMAGSGAAPRWPVPEGLEGVDADDFALVAAAWMNGRTLEQLASDFAREPAEVKAGLRRGTRALVHAHGAATRSDPQDTPAADTGVAVPFAPTVAEDLEARRALELADVTALGVLSREDAAAVRAAVHERGTGETTLWRTRVQAAETAVTWALRGIQEEPPLGLLDDELLRRLPTQEEDLEELTDQAEASLAAVPAGRRRPRRRWTWLGVAVALIAVAAAIVVSVLSAPTDVQRVDAATDRVATREVQLNPGGRIQAVSSRQERLGYVQITDLPGTPAGTGYQVWLVSGEDDDAAAQRLGERRSAAEFDEPVPFSAFDDTSRILVTRETAAEPATPSDDVVASTPVRPSGGPTYGGMPTTPREDG